MTQRTTGQWPIAVAGLVVLFMGAWTMYQEAMPNVRGGQTAIARLANMPDGTAPIGLTVLTQHRALLDCEELFRSARALEMQYLSQPERERLVVICEDIADTVLSRSPADSFAWLTLAAARAGQADITGFNTALRQSQLSGPSEGWLASMRVQFAEANLADLSAEALAGHDRDMRVAASASLYAAVIARRYVSDSDFRDRMNKVLEAMQPQEQRRFLTVVRATLTASGR